MGGEEEHGGKGKSMQTETRIGAVSANHGGLRARSDARQHGNRETENRERDRARREREREKLEATISRRFLSFHRRIPTKVRDTVIPRRRREDAMARP